MGFGGKRGEVDCPKTQKACRKQHARNSLYGTVSLKSIPSEMDVAPRYKLLPLLTLLTLLTWFTRLTLLTLFTLFTLLALFILLKLLYTAKTLACMPIYIVWKG